MTSPPTNNPEDDGRREKKRSERSVKLFCAWSQRAEPKRIHAVSHSGRPWWLWPPVHNVFVFDTVHHVHRERRRGLQRACLHHAGHDVVELQGACIDASMMPPSSLLTRCTRGFLQLVSLIDSVHRPASAWVDQLDLLLCTVLASDTTIAKALLGPPSYALATAGGHAPSLLRPVGSASRCLWAHSHPLHQSSRAAGAVEGVSLL